MHLEQAVQSVMSQAYDPIEYLIIDGGSTDGTLDVIRRYEDRIDYWVSEPDDGISDAMNKGINLSNGDIIAHLHADDYYADSSVVSSVQSEFAHHPNGCWLTGGIYFVNEAGKRLLELRVRKYSYQDLIKANIILHPSTFLKKRAFDQAGLFDPSLKYAMDYDLWIRIGGIGDPISLDKPLACFRVHAGSHSIAAYGKAFHEEWMIRKKFLKKQPLKRLYHYALYHVKRYENMKFYKEITSSNATSI